MQADCHSKVLRQLTFLLLLKYAKPSGEQEDSHRCDNVACKFLNTSSLRERLHADLETLLKRDIANLLDDVLGSGHLGLQFTDCEALLRRIEGCCAFDVQCPGSNGTAASHSEHGIQVVGGERSPQAGQGNILRYVYANMAIITRDSETLPETERHDCGSKCPKVLSYAIPPRVKNAPCLARKP